MLNRANNGTRPLLCLMLLITFVLLANFYFTQPQTVQASSCGTVYLYHANCTHSCTYYSQLNETKCNGIEYDHYTAPPANRNTGSFQQTYSGFVNPTGCPTMCYP